MFKYIPIKIGILGMRRICKLIILDPIGVRGNERPRALETAEARNFPALDNKGKTAADSGSLSEKIHCQLET